MQEFLEAIKADAGLQEKLKAAQDADAMVEIAKAAGFKISVEEVASKIYLRLVMSSCLGSLVVRVTQFGRKLDKPFSLGLVGRQ